MTHTQEATITITQLPLGPMDNFIYLLSDVSSKETAIVDPAWDFKAIKDSLDSNELTPKAVYLTHAHFDHLNALEDVIKAYPNIPIYISEVSAPKLSVFGSNIKALSSKGSLSLGQSEITHFHTPGHSADGQCFYSQPHLISGDTLFINGCGRCDLEDSNPEDMYNSLQQIKSLDENTLVYPGHNYDKLNVDSIKNQKQTNRFLTCKTYEEFHRKRMRS